MEVSGQLHAPAKLPLGKRPWYPLDRRLCKPQSQSGHSGKEKQSLTLPGIKPKSFSPQPSHYTKLYFVICITVHRTLFKINNTLKIDIMKKHNLTSNSTD